ncbi:MAG: hypothetical protein JW797_05340 [Bradymonadales bacterium]|nr:hypothetical protein [Bradymonadales bacterium]
MQAIQAVHPADYRQLSRWYATHLSDGGWTITDREDLGLARRLVVARDRERWLINLELQIDQEGGHRCRLALRRRTNEPPLQLLPGMAAGSECTADLPVTPVGPAVHCELSTGYPIEPLHAGVTELDATVDEPVTAVTFLADGELLLLLLEGDTITLGPIPIDGGSRTPARRTTPQILSSRDGGWLISWVQGDPPQRLILSVDSRGQRLAAPAPLSNDLILSAVGNWSRTLGETGWEYRTAWAEQGPEGPVWQVGIVLEGGGLPWRSGRFFMGAALPDPQQLAAGPMRHFLSHSVLGGIGPVMASDATGGSAMAWSSTDGLVFLPIGADGLPDGSLHRLEPGLPGWLGMVYGQESYWVVWDAGAGFWLRSDPAGCAGQARGSLQGRPLGVWSTPAGVISLVQSRNQARLVRLADRGTAVPDQNPEVIGTYPGVVEWSDLEVIEGNLRGLIRTAQGVLPAEWRCR